MITSVFTFTKMCELGGRRDVKILTVTLRNSLQVVKRALIRSAVTQDARQQRMSKPRGAKRCTRVTYADLHRSAHISDFDIRAVFSRRNAFFSSRVNNKPEEFFATSMHQSRPRWKAECCWSIRMMQDVNILFSALKRQVILQIFPKKTTNKRRTGSFY